MKKVVGILAHVDAGKTTFSEQILFHAQSIRKLGRVDHQDSFLDTDPMERSRGITIFSGLASFSFQDDQITWIDTPGHVDFSTDMERAVAIMDYAILIISCAEGVQSHTETVWRLLAHYHVPTFLFLNKTDREAANIPRTLQQIRTRLSSEYLDLRSLQSIDSFSDEVIEAIAAKAERLLERFFEGTLSTKDCMDALRQQIATRQCFPVMAGSALTGNGIPAFMKWWSTLTVTHHEEKENDPLAAQVYQIRHDGNTKLTFLKLLSGRIKTKDELVLTDGSVKINEIRRYHGAKYQHLDCATAGDVIAIPNIPGLRPGDRLGSDQHVHFETEPMMTADLLFDTKQIAPIRMVEAIRLLEEEEPAIASQVVGEQIAIHVMGKMQLEVLSQQLQERFGFAVSFGPCRVRYKETIAAPVIGIGHYEPLRHYAEVHIRLVPTPQGSGISFHSLAHVDELALNWQRLIETHVFEKEHKGVLTGSPLTDVRVELLCGRAHLKHTEGGDFRQSTYRAIRNALMQAKKVLLEPVCGFELVFPSDFYGTITAGLVRMQANTDAPEYLQEDVILRGEAILSRFSAWQEDFLRVTHGRGSLRLWKSHDTPVVNQEEIVNKLQYQPLADDTPDSVFCAHGAGFTVPWDQVKNYAHLSHEEYEENSK